MAGSFLRTLRLAIAGRREIHRTEARRRLRLQVEGLEGRLMMDAAHGGSGTLSDEHEAVMRLIDFHEIHETLANPVYYVARDGNGADPNYWSDVRNWSVKQFTVDPADPTSFLFATSDATHLPSTGDDVE